MTEAAPTIPDDTARELRALNDLELGALIADLGVDPFKRPEGQLRAVLADLAGGPMWDGPAADRASACLAREPRQRGRYADHGTAQHARATSSGLAALGALARSRLPDPDREGEAAGVRSVIGHMEAELGALRGLLDQLADGLELSRGARGRRETAVGAALIVAELGREHGERLRAIAAEHGTGPLEPAWDVVERIARERAEIRRFTGRADPVEGCKLLADEVAARGAKLAAWRDFALTWTGVAADDAAQIGAVRERLNALARVRAVPGGRHASELAPSACPAAELPDRMHRIWSALVARIAVTVEELVRWRQWAARVAPDYAEADCEAQRGRIGWLVASLGTRAASEEAQRHDLAASVEALGIIARDALAAHAADGLPLAASERVALLGRRYRERGELINMIRAEFGTPEGESIVAHATALAEAARLQKLTTGEILELRERLACPSGRPLLDHAAAIRGALGPCVPGVPETIARLRESLASHQASAAQLARIADAAAGACGGHPRGNDRERADASIARLSELAARAGAPPIELREQLAGVKRERDNLRREVEQNRVRSADVSRARQQTAEVNGELLGARDALKTAQAALSGWRSWAGLAGRLPPAELLAAHGDDAKLRAGVNDVLQIARRADRLAEDLAKAQRARKSLEDRLAGAHEEGRLEAEALHKGRGGAIEGWRRWARPHLSGASAIVNDGGLRIELSRVLDAAREAAKELRAPKVGDIASMVRKIREAAGPTTLSGPGALAEHVARLRDLAGASAADLAGAVDAREALREIAAITSAG